jgi:hypothetical protein
MVTPRGAVTNGCTGDCGRDGILVLFSVPVLYCWIQELKLGTVRR